MKEDEQTSAVGEASVDGLMVLCARLLKRGAIEVTDVKAVADAVRGYVDDDSNDAFVLNLLVDDRLAEMGVKA